VEGRLPEVHRPALSVVVPSVNGWTDLAGCLQALENERATVALEVLVPDRLGEPLRAAVRERFPWVRLIAAPVDTTIPELRALAFSAARGEAVGVVEDHVLVPPGWARRMLACLADGEDVVGGAVENAATETLVDWAAFLCEYSQLLPPLPAGPAAGLTGNNTVYRRTVLERHRAAWSAGRWEDHLHQQMRLGGVVLVQHPEIVVGHRKHYSVGEYAGQRFLYARSYAGARVTARSVAVRLGYGVAALLLPGLLLLRVTRTVWRKGRYRGLLLRAMPLLAWFVTCWGAGEVVGYWFGGGTALRRVK
jgi:hypothetical protein